MQKVLLKHHVRFKKTNESEPQMTCRKAILRYQNQGALLTWDKSMSHLCYCIDGIRHGSGVRLSQASRWNLGTQEIISLGGGVIRSSNEMSENSWSEGVTLICECFQSTRSGMS